MSVLWNKIHQQTPIYQFSEWKNFYLIISLIKTNQFLFLLGDIAVEPSSRNKKIVNYYDYY